jgi:hypothetical protein
MHPWEAYADKLADKLLDAGNITFGALVLGQLLSGQPFRWEFAILGLFAGIGFYTAAFLVIKWARKE